MLGKMIAPFVISRRSIKRGPVTIAGFLSSTVGLGQGARLALSAFRELGYEVTFIDIGDFLYWHKNISVNLGERASPDEGGVVIFHLNPPELSMVLPILGRRLIRHKKIIGCWAWELDEVPRNWIPGFKLIDEIWVPSKFVASAISRSSDVPLRVIHHPVRRPVASSRVRSDFGIAESAFVALTMFDMRSSAERKNPIGAIRAFRMAFGDRSDAILIVKIGNPREAPSVMSRIESEISGSSNIKLMFDKLSQEDHASLMKCSDVIISLHRSEGFGLVMAEAMLLGKPVIATAYSANMDFMDSRSAVLINYNLIAVNDPQGIYLGGNIFWADPDIGEAAQWLHRLASDPSLCRSIGEQARMKAGEVFSLASFKESIEGSESFIANTSSC